MGNKSPIKLKLRSNKFKCELCGRQYTTAAALSFHQQCVHSKAMKTTKTDVTITTKPKKVLVNLKSTMKPKKTAIVAKKKRVPDKPKTVKKPTQKILKKVEISQDTVDEVESSAELETSECRRTKFECPKCKRIYSVYFQAFKHIQRYHCINSKGQDVKPNSPDLIKPIPIELCTLCRKRLTSCNHVCSVIKQVDDIKFANKYTCSGCAANFISMKMYDLHVSGLHSEGVESLFFPTVKEFYDWKMDMEDQTKIKYTILGKYNSKQYYRCSYMPFIRGSDRSTAMFCPSTIVIQQFAKGLQAHFYKKHFGHPSINYKLSLDCRKYYITNLMQKVGNDVIDLKCYEIDLYSELKNLMSSLILDAAKSKSNTLKLLLGKALEMATILNDSTDSDKIPDTTNVVNKRYEVMSDKQISEALENVKSSRLKKVLRVSPAKRAAEEEIIDAKRLKLDTIVKCSSLKIVNSSPVANQPKVEPIQKQVNVIGDKKSEAKQSIELGKNTRRSNVEKNAKPEKNLNNNESPRPKVNRVSFMSSPSFNDTYKDFVDKNFAINTKKKGIVKTKIGQFKPNSPKSVKNKTKKQVNKNNKQNLSAVKITDYEVKERENDCNILILKI